MFHIFGTLSTSFFEPPPFGLAVGKIRHMPPRLAASITNLSPEVKGAVLITGSHGGRYPGVLAATAGVRAAIFNDAGIGMDGAGIAALRDLECLGIAAATASYLSCRIGDAEDMALRGRISHANAVAQACGVLVEQSCAEAAGRLEQAPLIDIRCNPVHELRSEFELPGQRRRIVLIDSASLVNKTNDIGAIVVTGSHGGLVGGDPAKAIQVAAYAAIFNDAGGGIDGAGRTRLAPLDDRGIAGFTVTASSARIGEARSTLVDGIVSAVNRIARDRGAVVGETAREVIERWARREPSPAP
ncbi:hypothetical protein [Bradyrhizobium sp.]|uniref:hypothetical protein n=1 Tax=Bradyrhizobium sp. TaxID=376 RepID=UPI004037943A